MSPFDRKKLEQVIFNERSRLDQEWTRLTLVLAQSPETVAVALRLVSKTQQQKPAEDYDEQEFLIITQFAKVALIHVLNSLAERTLEIEEVEPL